MIRVRPACDADKARILGLFSSVFGPRSAARTEGLWHWQWQLDPRLNQPGYRGVVAEWQDRVIGNVSYVPAALYHKGEPVTASWGINVVIHWGLVRRALRGQRKAGRTARSTVQQPTDLKDGLAAALINHPCNDPVQFGKHISEAMLTVCRKIGFTPVADSGSWGRPLSLTPRCSRLCGTFLGPIMAWPLNRLLPRIPRSPLPVQELEGPFDHRFDALWDTARGHFELIGLRDARTLEWRFHQHPSHRYTVHTLADGGRLRGYCVTTRVARGRFQQGRIVDLLTLPDDRVALRTLLGAALMHLRKSGAAAVDCYAAHPTLLSALNTVGFTARPKLHQVIVRGLSGSGLYVTELDSDGGGV